MIDLPKDATEFRELVNNAVSDRCTEMSATLRDVLARPDVVRRTLDALEEIVEAIDLQIDTSTSDDHYARSVKARDKMYANLTAYRAIASLVAPNG